MYNECNVDDKAGFHKKFMNCSDLLHIIREQMLYYIEGYVTNMSIICTVRRVFSI